MKSQRAADMASGLFLVLLGLVVVVAAFLEIARNPEIQAEMKKQGFVPVAMGQKESKAYIAKTTEIFKELVADLKK